MYDMPASAHVVLEENFFRIPFSALIASIIKFPPNKDQWDVPYRDLVCTLNDMAMIEEIISTVGEYSAPGLLFKKSHLDQLKVQILHVHPLKFLSTIFRNPHLCICMKLILSDGWKWSEYMKNLAPPLTLEADKGRLERHLLDFSAEIGVPPDHIRKYFQNRDWESLVRSLVNFYN